MYLQTHQNMSVYMVRQVAEYLALLGSSLGMVLCVCVGNRYASYTLLIVTQVSMVWYDMAWCLALYIGVWL
ncbi:hypothetical protein EON63_07370 [archaeon]|nr:MAG: hypothetical protein EON63_07370 [archaeon]